MDHFLDIASSVAYWFAAFNVLAAIYFHYRYTVGPSSSKNFSNTQFHWVIGATFLLVAIITDQSLSNPAAAVIAFVVGLVGLIAMIHIRRIRTTRYPSFLDQIATDDIIDRAQN